MGLKSSKAGKNASPCWLGLEWSQNSRQIGHVSRHIELNGSPLTAEVTGQTKPQLKQTDDAMFHGLQVAGDRAVQPYSAPRPALPAAVLPREAELLTDSVRHALRLEGTGVTDNGLTVDVITWTSRPRLRNEFRLICQAGTGELFQIQ